MATGKSWREIRSQLALNETRVDTYRRVVDAQIQIAESLLRRGSVSQEQLDEAMSASQTMPARTGDEDGVYLSSLARYVSALGGRLELRAVFGEQIVTVLDANIDVPDPPVGGDNQLPGSEAG